MRLVISAAVLILLFPAQLWAAEMSDATTECLDCHASFAPGSVAAWEKSRHAAVSPGEALKKDKLTRRISAPSVPDELAQNVVGCAECHTLNPEKHSDTFEHNGYQVHTVVTPEDCSTCHPVELKQYGKNIMSHAYGNLKNNRLYQDLARTINGTQLFEDGQITLKAPNPEKWEVVGRLLTYDPYAFIVPENDSGFRDLVNFTLIELINSGKFFELYDKWMGPKGEVPIPMTEEYKTLLKLQAWPWPR